jgi:uncharacterized protein (DUF58 family)
VTVPVPPFSAPAFIDPRQLEKLGDLQLLARTLVASLGDGLHRGVGSGNAAEFSQYRPYSAGDDTRMVDWRLYGRSDRLYLKESHQENSLRCCLLLDCSASMDYASSGLSKFSYGRMLAAGLAGVAQSQRDAIGLLAYHHAVETFVPPRLGGAHLTRVLESLQILQPGQGTDTTSALAWAVEVLPPRGMVVLISDLLYPVDEVLAHLRTLQARHHDVLVLQISDPAERDFPFAQGQALEDAEDGSRGFAADASARRQYLENRARHFDRLAQACLDDGIELEEFSSDEPLDRALHRFLRRRRRLARLPGKSQRPGWSA